MNDQISARNLNTIAGSAYSTSLIAVGEGSKVGWVDVSLSEG